SGRKRERKAGITRHAYRTSAKLNLGSAVLMITAVTVAL
ncbi:GMC oxidoreductase family protein, partial [Vibrio parahaemolyticus V-223/04]